MTIGLLLCTASVAAADRIVLRNLKIISDKKVDLFDEDGVRLDDGSTVTWDQIERISVAADMQKAADRMLADLGIHLYRIRTRLKVGDYEGLLPHAEAVYPRYVRRNSKTAYMVKQALMWALLDAGRREEALAPYLGCYEYLRTRAGQTIDLPGDRRLSLDAKTGMSPELPPVWFDADAAKLVMPDVLKTVSAMKAPRPEGTRVYFGTLAFAAGDETTALRVIGGIERKDPQFVQWHDIALAQREVLAGKPGSATARLAAALDDMTPQTKPVALYWLGMAKIGAKDERTKKQGALRLLHLPALYGKTYPELAGAGLYESMQALAELGDAKGSVAVRKELLDRYGQTYHARRVKAKSTSGKKE